MLQKAFGFLFLFVIAPLCTGLLWTGKKKEKRYGIDFIYLAGFLTQLAVFQLVAVPVMIVKSHGMALLCNVMTGALAGLSVAGAGCSIYEMRRGGGRKRGAAKANISADGSGKRQSAGRGGASFSGGSVWAAGCNRLRIFLRSLSLECKCFWLLAFLAVAFQMYMGFSYASFDGDDSYYVVQSVLADQTGVLNRIRPYTGLSTDLDIRHALATLPLWEAYVARMTGIHATIVAHSLLPLFLIPLTYLCYFEIGKKLFGATSIRLPIFCVLVSILQIWGNTSIYTNATFFLTRTWQGKAVLANLVLLVQLWLLLEIFDGKGKKRGQGGVFWGLLIVNNIVSAMMTSMGAFLAAMFLGIAGLLAAIRERKPSLLVRAACCCVPNVVYLLMLLLL